MLTFTNKMNQSIEFKGGTSFRLFWITGLDAAPIENRIQKHGFTDGGDYQGSRYEPRVIEMEFGIYADNEDHLRQLKRQLVNTFNSNLGLGTIVHQQDEFPRKIKGKIASGPFFPDGRNNATKRFQRGTLTIVCPDPYWRDVEGEKRTDIATWISNFHLPIGIPQEGVAIAYRTVSLFVNVENSGQQKTGMIIKFKALGTVVNPKILNINTQEYIKLNRTLVAGEIITINTNKNEKRVTSEVNGVSTNIFNNWTFGSTFLQLEIGPNVFRYEADQNSDALEVTIYHEDKFVGV